MPSSRQRGSSWAEAAEESRTLAQGGGPNAERLEEALATGREAMRG